MSYKLIKYAAFITILSGEENLLAMDDIQYDDSGFSSSKKKSPSLKNIPDRDQKIRPELYYNGQPISEMSPNTALKAIKALKEQGQLFDDRVRPITGH